MKFDNTNKLKEIIRGAGFRATDQRIELLSVLHSSNRPITLKDVMKKMHLSGVHEVTLYRMLSVFKDAKIIRQVDFGDVVPYFEMLDSKNDHHHIVCTNCKKVSDFVGCQVDSLIKKALTQTKDFKKVTSHSFELFGICNICSK